MKERFRLADNCESQIGVLKVEPDLPFAMFFLHFSPVSHRDQMKDSRDHILQKSFFIHLGEGKFLEDFLLFLLGLFGFAFCLFVFIYLFIFTSHPKD